MHHGYINKYYDHNIGTLTTQIILKDFILPTFIWFADLIIKNEFGKPPVFAGFRDYIKEYPVAAESTK